MRPLPNPKPIHWHSRGSGRTEWMLQEMLNSIAEGQPLARVIAHNESYAVTLMRRTVDRLQDMGAKYRVLRNKKRILVEDSVIEFVSHYEVGRARKGTRGFGEFWDHFVSERVDDYEDASNQIGRDV